MAVIYKTVEVEVEVEVEDGDCDCEELNWDTIERKTDIRTDLYRAIRDGDIDKAREVMRLMAMVDIDRELIWRAKREVMR